MKRYFSIILFFVIILQFVNADTLSINGGGSEEIVINPDTYIEGFFSGDGVIVLSTCGNGVLETPYEECDDGNTVSGDGCSSTCTTETTGDDDDGGGGGGSTGGTTTTIIISPTELNVNLAVNTNVRRTINVTNGGSTTVNLSITPQNLTNMILIPERYIQLSPGETTEVNVVFVAPNEEGIFTGKIFIGGRVVSVSLNVKTLLSLFDSNIIVLNDEYLVPQGDQLRTSVTLIPMGDKERMDVTLNYVIKDYNSRIYLTRSETVLVNNQVNFRRNFDTGFLPLGKYIVGLELIYPNGVAPSSAHFEITTATSNTFFGKLVFFIINLILIVLVLIIILLIWRIWKQMRLENKFKERIKNKEETKKWFLKDLEEKERLD